MGPYGIRREDRLSLWPECGHQKKKTASTVVTVCCCPTGQWFCYVVCPDIANWDSSRGFIRVADNVNRGFGTFRIIGITEPSNI
jgi:hypothetical protein